VCEGRAATYAVPPPPLGARGAPSCLTMYDLNQSNLTWYNMRRTGGLWRVAYVGREV